MHINSVSNLQSLHIVISINMLREICHVDPETAGEVALEGGLALGGVEDGGDLEFAGEHEGLAGLAAPGLLVCWDIEKEFERVQAGASIDCRLKQACVHQSEVLHPIVHGLLDLVHVGLEHEGLSSGAFT